MHEEIKAFIQTFNSSWTQGQLGQLEGLVHDQVVFISPDLKTKLTGIAPCLQSIKDYVDNAQTNEFEVIDQEIYVWDKTAHISLEYFIEYQLNNQDYQEKGKEFWTLMKSAGQWKMCCRAIVHNESVR